MDKAYYVYMLRCADGALYTGITTDVRRRVSEHAAGTTARGAKYTAAREVVRVERVWQTDTRSHALKLEYRIKTLQKPKKEWLIAHPDALAEMFSDTLDCAEWNIAVCEEF